MEQLLTQFVEQQLALLVGFVGRVKIVICFAVGQQLKLFVILQLTLLVGIVRRVRVVRIVRSVTT